jgi:catechol 2,3-dioxygenase-like lactoylglutathione lyase family enzyme
MLALEVIEIPVSNIDRAKTFYADLIGFHVDVDYAPTPQFRVVQLTPPGSACSIHLVSGHGATRNGKLYLVTDDLATEREKLLKRGVHITPIRHKEPLDTWAGGWSEGLDSQRHDYASVAELRDLDGNLWVLQERGYRGA